MTLEQEQEFLRAYQHQQINETALLEQYQRMIYYFIWKKRVREDLVQDCFQDCVILLFDAAKRYDFRKAKFSTFLLSELRRITTEYQRRDFYWNKNFKSLEELQEQQGFDCPDSTPDIELSIFTNKFKRAIDALSDREKLIIYMHFFQNLMYSEIAKELHLAATSVRHFEIVALRKIKHILEEEEI